MSEEINTGFIIFMLVILVFSLAVALWIIRDFINQDTKQYPQDSTTYPPNNQTQPHFSPLPNGEP